jgi:dihydroneopterin aldolase
VYPYRESMPMNAILIQDIRLRLHIGVTDKERRKRQVVLVSLEMQPEEEMHGEDMLEKTIDYSAVRRGLHSLLQDTRFKLIETVAGRSAQYVLDNFRAQRVTVTVKKFPYRDTASVGCRVCLEKQG